MKILAFALVALLSVPAHAADDIVAVLHRSHEARLAALVSMSADAQRAHILRASFDAVCRSVAGIRAVPPAELRIVAGAALAETLDGRVVVVDEALAELPENVRRFVLAHELGHVVLGHWSQMGQLFRRWIPGDVTPAHTDPVAARLAREASLLAHRQEYEADAFAASALARLGVTPDDLHAVFLGLQVDGDTATHPALGKRLAALQARSD